MSPSTVGQGLLTIAVGVLFAEVCRRARRGDYLDTVWWSQLGWTRPDWERIQAQAWGQVLLRFGVGFGWFIAALGLASAIIGMIR